MNIVTLQKTIFKNHPDGEEAYGYRMYDDYGQTYCNTLDKKNLDLPPIEFFDGIEEELDEVAQSMMDSAIENETKIDIDGDLFTVTLEADGYTLHRIE